MQANIAFETPMGCGRVPRIVNPLPRRIFQIRKQIVRLLLAFFMANTLMAGTGLAAPAAWLEHEKSHFVAWNDTGSPDSPQSSPDQPAGKTQNKHDCHASHYFQCHVAGISLTFSKGTSSPPPDLFLVFAPQGATGAPFRPPR